MTTALVVSRYFPFDTRKVHGVSERLGLQVRALGQVARRVECLFLVESDRRYAEAERARQEERLRGVWSPAVRLRIAPVASHELFVGSMVSRHNVHAVEHLVREIWPAIRQRVPEARLAIVGNGAQHTTSYPSRDPSVTFCGFADDLASWYRRARVVCCPIQHGAGTRVKIIEAAAHGKAVVSTRLGAEGLEFADGREIVLRETAGELAEGCVQLLRDAGAAAALGKAARARAERAYDRRAVVERLVRLFGNALGTRSRQ
jgi:glycosyltransferase involved in cell wall biosynthesis